MWTWMTVLAYSVVFLQATPLDDYVHRPDSYYKYTEIGSYRGPEYTMYILNMTSQKWKTEAVTDQPVWWHYLTVTIPDKINYTQAAFMLIDGGSNTEGPPKITNNFVALTTVMAVSACAIGADLRMIPNQPIVFKDDPEKKRRKEDAVIAWTWKKFIENTSDPEILLRMPMTKAAVRAMDTIQNFVKAKLGNNVEKFFIAGASKAGWTTWTTAAVDKRVVAMAPIVLDLLNMVKNLHHMYRNLGGWTFAFDDYLDVNITAQLDSEAVTKMAAIIDPLSYNDRYKNIAKFIITTGGDEFFQPDDAYYYFDQLEGPKYLRKLPNAEHSCAGHETSLMFSLRAFFLQAVTGTPFPKMTWKREFTKNGGKITLMTDRSPKTVDVFYARTIDGKRRDFRLLVASPDDPRKPYPHPVIWFNDRPQDLGNNTFVAEYDNPPEGWLAFFIQVSFDGVSDARLEFTTEAQIIPDTFPFPECHGSGCRGSLV
ncbi:autocrine proliferation repressor protein A-like [Saccostrea echinata]|uniref:autocrine proliferation repressor protein A-like n=1 Tax=Saccostrea echinata TaxID=191078 RepID=UPI002A7FE408|nr:autocrine proliferation repressor protein A-like [Saccostrea echinata]